MLLEQANEIIDEYSRLVRGVVHAVRQGDSVLIVTPTLNRNNDCMSVLIGDSPDGEFIISDLGETLAELELSGFSLSSGPLREELEEILRIHGVSRTGANELYLRAGTEVLAPKISMFLQAMASVDQLAKG